MMKLNLEGQVAIVTGASRAIGIGAATARALAELGADLFLTYYRPYDASMAWGSQADEVELLLAELRALGRRACGLELDLSQPAAARNLLDAVEANLGRPTILINNATHSERDGITNLNAAQIDQHYVVNLRGTLLLCAEFVRRWQQQAPDTAFTAEPADLRLPRGRIINLSSGQGVGPMPGELAYVATKGAIEAFTLSLSAEVARLGITVNAVDPGATDTGWMSPADKAAWYAAAPFGRIGLPQDAARLIRFLASPEGGWITGQVIHSRGGT
jgi:3-oxoacyl-[acyl-carrier protein] reductase